MKFEIDNQTLNDLAIFQGGDSGGSIFWIFNKTVTYGGAEKLREFFSTPLTEGAQINQRLNVIKYLQEKGTDFVYDKGSYDFIEHYLKQGNKPTSVSRIRSVEKWLAYKVKGNSEYYIIHRGIEYTLEVLENLLSFTQNNSPDELPEFLQQFHALIQATLNSVDFEPIRQFFAQKQLGAIDIAKADHIFRYSGYVRLRALIDTMYQLDALTTVGSISKKHGFSFPVVSEDDGQQLILQQIFHPLIDNPVPNDAEFSIDKNICFVTGANMAGKSTFLKSVGICVFLSQIGFPVPAVYMKTGGFKGLITTINLSDNITQGNSHFYSEVLRVKYVAEKMSQSQQIFVIFDELFRGTNVKDAYDASLAIIKAFSKVRKCFFIVSTHIVEVANELAEINNISFKYMETIFDEDIPKYSYKLQNGITEERMGMWIVNNEGIVDMINKLNTLE
jgi:DNA mismatch repair protein MutS